MLKLFSSRKKGSTDIAPTELIGMVLGVIILVGLLFLGAKLAGLFLSKQKLDATINNFDILISSINSMVKDTDKFTSEISTYSISDEHILVGFSYRDKGRMHTACTNEDIFFSRPALCKDSSCLCIYEDTLLDDFDSDLEDSNVIRCNKFNKNIVFVAPGDKEKRAFQGSRSGWSDNHPISGNYEYLVLYGSNCHIGTDFQVKQLYVEKIQEKDNIFIYISDYSKSKKKDFEKRQQLIKKK